MDFGRLTKISRKEEETMEKSTKYLVELALLVAIIVLMAFTPIGYIKTAGIEITLIVIPVAVGAVTMGPKAGAILGATFGLTSFIQCFGMSAFGTLLMSQEPYGALRTFIICVPTRILVGLLTGFIYQGLRKTSLPSGVAVTIANLCCPLLNTLLFVGTVILLFAEVMKSQFGMGEILPFFVGFVGLNGLIEAVACFIIGAAVSTALKKAIHYN